MADARSADEVESGFHRLWVGAIIGTVGVVSIVCGLIGWTQSLPQPEFFDVIARTLGLFASNFDLDGTPTPTLMAARILAPLTTMSGIIAIAVGFLHKQFTVWRAELSGHHVVILGGGPEAPELARDFRVNVHDKVVVIGAVEARAVAELRRARVLYLREASDASLRRILRLAKIVIVSASSDDAAADLARRVRNLAGPHTGRISVLMDERDLVALWANDESSVVWSRAGLRATSLLRQHPPFPEHAIAPPPIVVGDGPLASEIARRIVTGWQQPGERIVVNCVGDHPDWMEAARVGLGDRAEFRWHEMAPHGALAPDVISGICAQWSGPGKKPWRYPVVGARVYVAYEEEADTVPIAAAISRLTSAEAYGLVEDHLRWTAAVEDSRPGLLSSLELLAAHETVSSTLADLLAEEIVAELARWPRDGSTLFPLEPSADRAVRLADHTPEARQLVEQLARSTTSILGEVGIAFATVPMPDVPPIVLSPWELGLAASRIAAAIDLDRTATPRATTRADPVRLRCLELAARLPTLAARAGFVPYRTGEPSPLTPDVLMRFALAAHEAYKKVSAATGNATGSENARRDWDALTDVDQRSNLAQVLDIPVKLAALGSTWRTSAAPAVAAFGADELEYLAELEHRRWQHFEIRNGRRDHDLNVTWNQLTDGQREYDRSAVKVIPELLATIGLELVDTYERVGEVEARRLDGPFEWKTSNGDTLRAMAGDWLVVSDDGSERTVAEDVFEALYEPVGPHRYRGRGRVTARRCAERTAVSTREGEATAEPGDWLITDAHWDSWPVPDDQFRRHYVRVEP